jgi:two-component system nitrate/nitrite response regulator NarL
VDSEPDLEMTGHCATVDKAIDILRQKTIDLVLLDYDLGKENGFQFIARALEMGFEGRFLIVTAGMSDAQSVEAVRLGVGGIFTKHSSPVSLARAIRKVMAGETWLDQTSLQALVEVTKRQETPDSNRPFTERENQVLQGVFEGFSNKEIGGRLDISDSSVKAALQQLFHKTGVRTRSQLVRIALEKGFGRRK